MLWPVVMGWIAATERTQPVSSPIGGGGEAFFRKSKRCQMLACFSCLIGRACEPDKIIFAEPFVFAQGG